MFRIFRRRGALDRMLPSPAIIVRGRSDRQRTIIAGATTTPVVYRISGGEIVVLPADADYEVLPDFVIRMPSMPVDGTDIARRVRHAAETVARCVPWTTLWLSPGRPVELKADEEHTFDGIALCGRFDPASAIIVNFETNEVDYADTLHHEIWHAAAAMLSDDAIAAVNEDLRGGKRYLSKYWDDAEERAARCYARWASLMDDGYSVNSGITKIRGAGLPPVDMARAPLSAAAAFEAVYSGVFAAELRARGTV